MNNQFATQFLLEELDEFESLRSMLSQLGASEDSIEVLVNAVAKGHIEPSKAVDIIKATAMHEDGAAAGAPAGGSTTGGGVTNGASFTPGAGEQYAMGTKKVRKTLGEESEDIQFKVGDKVKYQNQDWEVIGLFPEKGTVRLKHLKGLPSTTVLINKIQKSEVSEDAPRLAGEPSKTDSQGAKNLNAYKSAGFTKAPSAQEAGKKLKSIDVEELWEEEPLNENYFRFRNETKTRSKPEQYHQAVKTITKKLDEVNRLLEFTGTLKTELSEGEDTFEVKHNTKKAMDKVRGKVVEAYKKLKQL